jgi:hypothetical protein
MGDLPRSTFASIMFSTPDNEHGHQYASLIATFREDHHTTGDQHTPNVKDSLLGSRLPEGTKRNAAP